MASAPTAPADVRKHLVKALKADLIGPYDPESGRELLRLPPSRWYVTGFLVPDGGREDDDPDEGEVAAGNDDPRASEAGSSDTTPQPKRFLPASMGLTILLPPATATDDDTLRVRVRYADYTPLTRKELEALGEAPPPRDRETRMTLWWKRMPVDWVDVSVEVAPGSDELLEEDVPNSRGLKVVRQLEVLTGMRGVKDGSRAVTVFLVNYRAVSSNVRRRDESAIFQVELAVNYEHGIEPRPDRRLERSPDFDDKISDLQYRDYMIYVVGHGVSAEPIRRRVRERDRVVGARTVWLPKARVDRVKPRDVPGVTVEMERLAKLSTVKSIRDALRKLPKAYAAWIEEQSEKDVDSKERSDTRDELVDRAERALERIATGIEILEEDPQALEAFKLANQAMADAARRRSPERYADGKVPAWRLFQLAFILLNLRGIVSPAHTDREKVELIFFPTGGGKTEAYLGVIAFTLILRRLRGQARADAGLGVAVILRYTLRLLTLDQLGRAATLICALEQLRTPRTRTLGNHRFAIGLWVGRSATANRIKDVARQITDYKNSSSNSARSPFPLTHCPWCSTELKKDSLTLTPGKSNPTGVRVGCSSFRCDFAVGKNRDGLPILFIDEQIYRELPSFLVATVDKFAMMPWKGDTAKLFGRVHSRHGHEFYGALDGPPEQHGSERLPAGLRPPELIVQDELHLISGPLGTMVGLFETAVEELSIDHSGPEPVKPKIIAATATVRRSERQIQALYGGRLSAIFPPHGVDAWDTFFAEQDNEANKRMYLGVAAPGRALKRLLLNSYTTLLGSAMRCYDQKGGAGQPADPYMTVVGYFNSLRELGGMRRLVEDEVRVRCDGQARGRQPENFNGEHHWLANRTIKLEPVELTSRESTAQIARSKSWLGLDFSEKAHVDVALASNMISVGIDIDRLGLMVVAGQPKSTSEYIQATSRVGRDDRRPGLVVVVFNVHKPRDRSHYEHFGSYHESFYRHVEPQSLTPFSTPALERGFAATIVAMTRLLNLAMTPSEAVVRLPQHRDLGEAAVRALADRAARHIASFDQDTSKRLYNSLVARGRSLLDSWSEIAAAVPEGAGRRVYSPWDRGAAGKPLLRTVESELLDPDSRPPRNSPEAKFTAPTSMRDVEGSVHIWVNRYGLRR